MSASPGTIPGMSGDKDKLSIDTEGLEAAATGATKRAAAVHPALTTPSKGVSSPIDTSAVAVASAIQALVTTVETADTTAATVQSGCLNEFPKVLVQADQQGAEKLNTVQFPTPGMAPSSPDKVWKT